MEQQHVPRLFGPTHPAMTQNRSFLIRAFLSYLAQSYVFFPTINVFNAIVSNYMRAGPPNSS